jgi:signal transduction histidine kinase
VTHNLLAMEALPTPPRLRIPTRWLDAAIAAGLALLQVVAAFTGKVLDPAGHPLPFVLALAAALALYVRRQRPLEVLALAAAAVLVQGLVEVGQTTSVVLLVAVYTVCSRRPRDTGLAAAAVAAAALIVGPLVHETGQLLPAVVSRVGTVAAATATGLYFGARWAYFDALRERAEQLARERTLLAGLAVDEERVRIARELHDVVAHHVTLLTVQAGAVRETLDPADPARPVLDSMMATGRQAMQEMRRMLDVLRPEPGAAMERGPQPGIEEIGALVEQTRAAGLPVQLRLEGTARPLPAGMELSAYRIVQEALTNVVKHAGPARVDVLVRYLPDALELSVRDDGRGAVVGAANGGHGLVGMRERVALFGGELEAGARAEGGYALRALLPLEGRPA